LLYPFLSNNSLFLTITETTQPYDFIQSFYLNFKSQMSNLLRLQIVHDRCSLR